MPQTPIRLKQPVLAAILTWLVPGLGQIYQGRVGKGILFLVCITGLYVAGLALGDWTYSVFCVFANPFNDFEHSRPSFICQFWVGLPGLLALVQGALIRYGFEPILNWNGVGFLAQPSENAINALHPGFGSKLIEIGWLYTVVAGLLNVLAIYDALEGPFYRDDDERQVASGPNSSRSAAEPAGVPSESRAQSPAANAPTPASVQAS